MPARRPPSARLSATARQILRFRTPAAFDAWLAKHHAASTGITLELARTGTDVPSITSKQALELALTWGWIDARTKSIDETWWHQDYVPRGKRSLWSRVNREKVEALVAAGRVHPAGLAAIEAAKADGRWAAAYEPASTVKVPDDLAAALAADVKARAFFDTLDSRNRYAILHRLHTAKKPETRARRLASFLELLRAGKKLHG